MVSRACPEGTILIFKKEIEENMEMELKNIIEQIKKEGVDEADKKATSILSQAEEKAKNIVMIAEKEKETILMESKRESQKMKTSAEEAIRQAAKNTILTLREEIVKLFDKVVKDKVSQSLSEETIKEILKEVVKKFDISSKDGIDIVISKENKEKIEQGFLAELKKEFTKSIFLKVSDKIESGFRIGEKDKNSFYDFTDEAIADALSLFLNPKINSILREGK